MEGQALVRGYRLDGAAMQNSDPFRNGQSDPVTACRGGAGGIGAIKAVEQMLVVSVPIDLAGVVYAQ